MAPGYILAQIQINKTHLGNLRVIAYELDLDQDPKSRIFRLYFKETNVSIAEVFKYRGNMHILCEARDESPQPTEATPDSKIGRLVTFPTSNEDICRYVRKRPNFLSRNYTASAGVSIINIGYNL